VPFVKLVFSANRARRSDDVTHDFFRRRQVVPVIEQKAQCPVINDRHADAAEPDVMVLALYTRAAALFRDLAIALLLAKSGGRLGFEKTANRDNVGD
jgi:hypothetical protein